MSIAKLNQSLLGNIALYASESSQDLAKISQINKAFNRAVCDKVHPIFLATYAKEPSLQNEVAKTKQLSTLFQNVVQGVQNIGGGKEYLASLKLPVCSLQSTQLAELAQWSIQQKAESLLKLFNKVAEQIPAAQTFLNSLAGTEVKKADAIRTWLSINSDLLNAVTEINLGNSGLTIVPGEIALFTNLKQLNLSANQLQTLPASIGNFPQLEVLLLLGNQLQTVPTSLGNLSKLRWLVLDDNKLQTVPASLGNLSKLVGLGLSGNPIKFVPKALKTSSVKVVRENIQIINAEELQLSSPSLCQVIAEAKRQQ